MKNLILLIALFFLVPVFAKAECTLAVTVDGAITAATTDYLTRAEKEAQKLDCKSILLRMNTPGGDLQSTRRIVEKILASPYAYLCLITPNGAHAGSAGALILQACHVNGGVAATQLGAATPIMGGGGQGGNIPEDLRNKIMNDTISWSESLARLRGRNVDFAKKIVSEAKVVAVEEAVKIKALDFSVRDEAEFIGKAATRRVQIQNDKDREVVVGPTRELATDLRYRILSFIADPEFVYLLFMISLGLLYFEFTNPGFGAPGVAGVIGLIFALIGFNKLEVQWGGLALMIVGIAFLVAELFITSFGILGIGGLIAFVVGSVFLFDPAVSGYTLPLSLILTVALCFASVFLGLGYLALKSFRRKKHDWDSEFEGLKVPVTAVSDARTGQIQVKGETWRFEADSDVQVGDTVEIMERKGITLTVRKI